MRGAGAAADHRRHALGIRRVTRPALVVVAAGMFLLGVGMSGSGQSIPAAAAFVCTFRDSPTECGFAEQAKGSRSRASLVTVAGMRGVRLRTEPGDSDVAGSAAAERNDLALSQAQSDCYEGKEQWWAHSILFPDDYVAPPAPTPGRWSWGVVFDFHHTGNTGQANFQVEAMPDPIGLRLHGYGGDPAKPITYEAAIGPVVKNLWYHFVYHVKWSAGNDGFFDAWVNGVRKLEHRGPTLYSGMGCYLKLANYHSAFGRASSVIHARVVRGPSADAVSLAPLE